MSGNLSGTLNDALAGVLKDKENGYWMVKCDE